MKSDFRASSFLCNESSFAMGGNMERRKKWAVRGWWKNKVLASKSESGAQRQYPTKSNQFKASSGISTVLRYSNYGEWKNIRRKKLTPILKSFISVLVPTVWELQPLNACNASGRINIMQVLSDLKNIKTKTMDEVCSGAERQRHSNKQ